MSFRLTGMFAARALGAILMTGLGLTAPDRAGAIQHEIPGAGVSDGGLFADKQQKGVHIPWPQGGGERRQGRPAGEDRF